MTINQKIKEQLFNQEMEFQMSRSSGPGGQNVNKVNSKVTLSFCIPNSSFLSESEKEILIKKLATRTDLEGVIQVQCQEKRSQLQNKELAIRKFYDLLTKAFQKRKIRIATKPSKAALEKRLKEKKSNAEKKQNRKSGSHREY